MRRYLATSLLLFVVGLLCLAQQPSKAYWQSRDSNYNKSVSTGCSFPAGVTAALVGWYKADTGAYVDAGVTLATNGQSVQQWNNNAGASNLIQLGGSGKPTWSSTGMNGLPTLQFSAAINALMEASSFPMGTGNTSSAFVVANVSSTNSAFARILEYKEAATARDWFLLNVTPTGLVSFDGSVSATATITNDTNLRLGSIWDGPNTSAQLYVNNSPGTAGTTVFNFANAQTLEVGAAAGAANATNINISEIVITTSAISSGDRNSLDTYFTCKYGI